MAPPTARSPRPGTGGPQPLAADRRHPAGSGERLAEILPLPVQRGPVQRGPVQRGPVQRGRHRALVLLARVRAQLCGPADHAPPMRTAPGGPPAPRPRRPAVRLGRPDDAA